MSTLRLVRGRCCCISNGRVVDIPDTVGAATDTQNFANAWECWELLQIWCRLHNQEILSESLVACVSWWVSGTCSKGNSPEHQILAMPRIWIPWLFAACIWIWITTRIGEISWNEGTLINILSTTHQRKAPQGKILDFFSLRCS